MRNGLYRDARGALWVINGDSAQLIRENGQWLTTGDRRPDSMLRNYPISVKTNGFTRYSPYTRIENL